MAWHWHKNWHEDHGIEIRPWQKPKLL
jgi:hypothetical protein